MAYAVACHIPFVGIIGADEAASGKVTVRAMGSGEQQTIAVDELIRFVSD